MIEHWYIRDCLGFDSPLAPPPPPLGQWGLVGVDALLEVWTQPDKRHFGNWFTLGSEKSPVGASLSN